MNDFPNAKGYEMLTAADVEATRTKKCAKPIAAVIKDKLIAKYAHASVEEIVTRTDRCCDAIRSVRQRLQVR